jgi:hypothetical protein
MGVPIKTATELTDPELERRWASRRLDRQSDLLRRIWRAFLDQGEPVPLRTLEDAGGDSERQAVGDALARLDADDLIVLRDGAVRLAYPFSGDPTAFVVVLPGGAERFACCAIDALGIAPMLGQAIGIRGRCHHCEVPLAFAAGPAGPSAEADGVMVWIGRRAPGERRVCTGL